MNDTERPVAVGLSKTRPASGTQTTGAPGAQETRTPTFRQHSQAAAGPLPGQLYGSGTAARSHRETFERRRDADKALTPIELR
jgi:hypothetical protein